MSKKKKHYFDDPKNVWRVIKTFFVICVLLLISDFFVPKHGVYYWENIPEFYAAYGLVACILLVLGAKYILRTLVKRNENYYD